MGRIIQVVGYYLVNGLFFCGAFVLNIVSALLLLLPRRLCPVMFVRSCLRGLFRIWFGLAELLNLCRFDFEELSKYCDGKPRIWVMNHPTIVDGIYLLSLLPRSICIYKDSIGASPFYGFIAKLAHHLPNDPGPDMVREAVGRLKKGEQLIVFPEGTRREHMDTNEMKGGFALMAIRAGATIELLWLDNPPGFMTREANPWVAPKMPGHIKLRHFGSIEPRTGENASGLFERVAKAYDERIELRKAEKVKVGGGL